MMRGNTARLFVAVGITANEAEELRNLLLQAVKIHEAQLGRRDVYGQRYIIDFPLEWQGNCGRSLNSSPKAS